LAIPLFEFLSWPDFAGFSRRNDRIESGVPQITRTLYT